MLRLLFSEFLQYIKIKLNRGVYMVVLFEKLSRAIDAFNANRIESEQVEYFEVIKELGNPLDENEVMRLIIELYEES